MPAPDAAKLEELLRLRQGLGVPLAMAVVPDWLVPDVTALIAGAGDIHVLQHGVAHADYSGGRGRRMELCGGALPSGLRQALIRSRNVLSTSFPSSLIEVMVPPWNRIDEAVLSILAGSGFLGLSTLGPRCAERRHGLVVNNVHIDIIDWKSRKTLCRCRGMSGGVSAASREPPSRCRRPFRGHRIDDPSPRS